MTGSWNGTQYTGDDTDEVVTGTNADEQIWTFLGRDVIYAGGGNDTVDSGMDSDTLYGGSGNDLLYDLNSFDSSYTGLVGKDRVYGGAGNDTVWFNSVDGLDVAGGGSGIDTLVVRFDFLGARTSLPIEFALNATAFVYVDGLKGLTASSFERVDITTSDGDDILTGGALGDTLRGGAGADFLSGLGGDDWIDVGQGNFTAYGGAGRDTLVLDLSADFTAQTLKLDGNFSINTAQTVGTATGFEVFSVTTAGLDDRLTGGALNDSLDGGTGNDTLFGGAGNDLLTLGQGAGRAYGGDGDDRITYSNGFFSVTPDPGDFADGGAGNDTITFARGGNNRAYGGTGNDGIGVLYDNSTFGTVNHFYGGAGNDQVGGGNGADHLFGGSGNDTLSGFPRVQEMLGGSGNDVFILNGNVSDPVPVGQVLNGGLGFDRLNWTGQLGGTADLTTRDYTTSNGSHWLGFETFGLFVSFLDDTTITFGAGDDRLDGNATAFGLTVYAGGGNDSIRSRSFASDLHGGAGNDLLTATRGIFTALDGGSGNDILTVSGNGSATLTGGAGRDIAVFGEAVVANLRTHHASGAAFSDTLNGIEGLSGSSGNDTLIGNNGNNQFFAGFSGSDLIKTGKGADTIVLQTFQSGTAHVTDFNHARDTIGLSGFNVGASAVPNGPLDAAHFLTGSFATAPTATLAEAQVFYDRSLGNLWMDRDGTGAAAPVLVLVLDNHPMMDASDLIVGDYLFR